MKAINGLLGFFIVGLAIVGLAVWLWYEAVKTQQKEADNPYSLNGSELKSHDSGNKAAYQIREKKEAAQ